MININLIRPSMNADFTPAANYVEGSCLHDDVKPLGVAVGSIMTEVDTGDVYFFNGSTWVKQFSLQG